MEIFYIRKAIGKNKKPFNCYKFRTMKKGAESCLEKVLKSGSDKYGKPLNDERITSFGKFLRKYWIDEIPQLVYNLPKGDMKLVGIRPNDEKTWKNYSQDIKERALQQKPGFLSVQYYSKEVENFDDNLKILKQYLDEYETSPFSTDLKYFFGIISNIVFQGARGI